MPDCREGQYITRELNIPFYCPTRNNRFIIIMTQIWWASIEKKLEKGERESTGAAAEARTRAPSLVKTALALNGRRELIIAMAVKKMPIWPHIALLLTNQIAI